MNIKHLKGRVVSVNMSETTGVRKERVHRANLIVSKGVEGDAHAGNWHRQVSLLAMESIEKMREKGLEVNPGDFAENITTEGLPIMDMPVGTQIRIGDGVLLEITQIGKQCHKGCAIFQQVGECIMPKEGIFAKVLKGGEVAEQDPVVIEKYRFKAGILTISDKAAAGAREDQSGKEIEKMLANQNEFSLDCYAIIPDEASEISDKLIECVDELGLDLVITTGGTGLSPRDRTPEATLAVIDREVKGMAEAMRHNSLKKTPHAMLSRAVVGVRNTSLIVNLPGSPKAAKENLAVILPAIAHALLKIKGDPSDCGG